MCFFSGPAEKSSEWMDRYRLKFLGSVQVPFHKGNDVLCAAMQKVELNNQQHNAFYESICGFLIQKIFVTHIKK